MTADSDRPWLVAIDTSTDWAGVALTNGAELAELNWTAGRRQTVTVLSEIDHLLGTARISTGQIGAVGVALGPGSFSGLRVGLSVAKGMALASDLKLIGISTMDITIGTAISETGPVIGVIRAGRSRYVWATNDAPAQFQSGPIQELVDFAKRAQSPVTICGEYSELDARLLAQAIGDEVPAGPNRLRRGAVLADMAWNRWQAGSLDDPAALEPIYLHRTD